MKILEIKTRKRLIGNIGERAAAKYYKKQGYRILATNFVGGDNEIDLVARNKTEVAFIEVKTRTVGHESENEPRPASAVTKEKQRGIMTAAKWFSKRKTEGYRLRFDVAEVYVSDEEKPKVVKIVQMENTFHK